MDGQRGANMIIAPSITSLCFPVDEVHRRFPLPGHDIKDTTWKNERITILMQYSLHLPSRHMLREIAFVFPKNSNIVTSSTTDASITTTNETEAVKIMACFLRSDNDLIHVSEQTNRERDVLLATFLTLVHKLRIAVTGLHQNYWLDATDPASGYPVYSPRGTSIYPDVDGSIQLLKYSSVQSGCCRIVIHPMWGSCNYPCTIFTNAPTDILMNALNTILSSSS